MDVFRWGVIGPGHIARRFAEDMRVVGDGEIVAVASRVVARAEEFARAYDVARVHASYEALIADDSLDALYVATPHPMHAEVTIAALRAGRPVLCEKPLAPTRAEGERMVAAAREAGVFLMEGIWSRFLPSFTRARAWIADGRIGTPRLVQGSYGLNCRDPHSRLLNPDLAGGGLLDVGVYPLALAQWIFGGTACAVTALGHVGATGVDEQCGVLVRYAAGQLGITTATVITPTPADTWIFGTEAGIRFPAPGAWGGQVAELWNRTEMIERVDEPLRAHGFEYEIEEVQRCVRAGLGQSPQVPHSDSLEILRICDLARADMGVRYPFEE